MIFNAFQNHEPMKVIERGILVSGEAGTCRATYTFPSVVPLAGGELLASCRAGSEKDAADETVVLFRSSDGGHTWSNGVTPFGETVVNGVRGSLKIAYITALEGEHLMAAVMWVDRQTYPGKALFNADTEGCLPMAILLSDSYDNGKTWSPLRVVPMPPDLGPPSLTSPVVRLKDGTLAMSIETNKHYLDKGKWCQRVVLLHSADGGKSWGKPATVIEDPEGRIFYWDLRTAVAPDGRLIAFSWTYDRKINKYLNISRLIGDDGGRSWSPPEDLGFADQPAHPAILPDGHTVLAWVNRFGNQTIRAGIAPGIDQPFIAEKELVLYHQEGAKSDADSTGKMLSEMNLWNFGLPYGEALPGGEVMVFYYAGREAVLDIHWVKISPEL